jgi:hypothetical protein
MPGFRDDTTFDRPSVRGARSANTGIGVSFAPTGTAAAPAASADPFAMFNDPASNFLTQIIKGQLGSLSSAPATDPTSAGLMSFLTGQLGKLSSAGPVSFSAGNGLLGDFITEGRKRIDELNQAPFSAQEEQALKTRTRNDLATQRDQAKQRILEDASRRGVMDSSGIVGSEMTDLEGQTTAQDAKNQNDLMLYIADKASQNKNLAAQIAQQLASAGSQDAAMQLQAATASEAANSNRQGQIMGIANALANMAAQQRGEARARQGDVVQLASMLAELPIQRLQLASNVLNGQGGSIPNLFGDVSQLNNAQTYAQNNANAATGSWLNALSTLASYFANKK